MWAARANEHRDQGRYPLAGRDMGILLTELQVHALTAGPINRTRALTALVQSCVVAGIVANKIAGNIELSISAARRGFDMAARQGDPGMIGLARWSWAGKLTLLSARGRASRVLTAGIDELGSSARLGGEDTLSAQMLGFLHLAAAQCAA